jgi:hypothetical protein
MPAHAQIIDQESLSGQMGRMGSMSPWGGMGPDGMGYGGMGYMDPFMSPFSGIYGMQGMDGMSGMGGMPFMFPGMSGNREHAIKITSLPGHSGYGRDMMATIESVPQVSVFAAILKAEGFEKDMKGAGNYLIFAPTDKSLSRDFSVKDPHVLINNKGFIKGIIENSIVYKPDGHKDKNLTALNGKEIVMLRTKQGVSANGADVVNYVSARNGMLIVTDGAVGT